MHQGEKETKYCHQEACHLEEEADMPIKGYCCCNRSLHRKEYLVIGGVKGGSVEASLNPLEMSLQGLMGKEREVEMWKKKKGSQAG